MQRHPGCLFPARREVFHLLAALVLLLCFHWANAAPSPGALPKGWSEITFSGVLPQADPEEVKWRLHCVENPGPFAIEKEKFRLFVPPNFVPEQTWGVLIWVDAGNAPSIPVAWEKVLENRKLLVVAGVRSGNSRIIFDRMRMAVHASFGIQQRCKIDPGRIYVAGFSGGGRVAGMLGIAWPDFFSGAAPMMGVNFYTEIPSAKGTRYPPDFIPDDQALEIARFKRRHVLVTGEKDFNRGDILSVYQNGYRKERFWSVNLVEFPGLGHALPDAVGFEKIVSFLEGDGARH
jgi:hypothetical protein